LLLPFPPPLLLPLPQLLQALALLLLPLPQLLQALALLLLLLLALPLLLGLVCVRRGVARAMGWWW
jgi:hypothetical protein